MTSKPIAPPPQDKHASARQKTLLIGRHLGLASDSHYQASEASLSERSTKRQQILEDQYQQNLESIYKISLALTPSDVTGTELDSDWTMQYLQLAKQINHRKMQELWARILASEVVKPGHFSIRSLQVLQQLTQREAIILERAKSLSGYLNNDQHLLLLSGYRNTGGLRQYWRKPINTGLPLSQFGLPYSAILTLQEANILHKSEFETGLLDPKQAISWHNQQAQSQCRPKSAKLVFTYYRFTPIGDELVQLVSSRHDSQYWQAMRALFKRDFAWLE
ncbi:TIGR03899 family protein [Shewanella sp. NIFS-20-20]|uniref:TIGR03899 family protein n=1 Tax=Shewanella sp. NIFS-20-20 TaxID=2853806 RepID=UPI001C43B5D8|nr:TIGR03899 family protein [Shewanella sp. NIFS-20-20]MBV7315847.1 TIGR03899 family protein [Shewanella sp. NIFS-20-20]